MYYFIVLIVIAALIIWYTYPKEKEVVQHVVIAKSTPVDTGIDEEEDTENFTTSWKDIAMGSSLDQSTVDSHRQYVSNMQQYSSGANFTAVADDNTSPIFTNFIGFSRPRYVPVDPTARQIPDVDTEVLKRNRYMTFTSDLDEEERGRGRNYTPR